MKYKHLFGPVHSRRLGYSLGVDVVPYKYCPLNCVYCEVNRTTHLTLEREEFFPLEEITAELDDFLKSRPPLDFITFSGAGEPTLYSRIGELIQHIKRSYPHYHLALLTNGVLLSDPALRKEILPCDMILPSLDAGSDDAYALVNRPHPALKAGDLIRGLSALRGEFTGTIWLEVFIIAGVNDSEDELAKLRDGIARIQPDRVQINSLDRPGAEEWVKPAGKRVLSRVQRYFEAGLEMPVEIIASVSADEEDDLTPEIERDLSALLIRRPSTAEELSRGLGLHINEVSKILRQLMTDGRVAAKREERGVFYSWKH